MPSYKDLIAMPSIDDTKTIQALKNPEFITEESKIDKCSKSLAIDFETECRRFAVIGDEITEEDIVEIFKKNQVEWAKTLKSAFETNIKPVFDNRCPKPVKFVEQYQCEFNPPIRKGLKDVIDEVLEEGCEDGDICNRYDSRTISYCQGIMEVDSAAYPGGGMSQRLYCDECDYEEKHSC